MHPRHQRIFLGVFLILVPPVAAAVFAALSVGVSKHQTDVQSPSLYDALFPLFFLASFFTVPIGIYIIYRALRS
jgi:hypothetical protein